MVLMYVRFVRGVGRKIAVQNSVDWTGCEHSLEVELAGESRDFCEIYASLLPYTAIMWEVLEGMSELGF